jgi:hypothetical protein
VGRENCEQTDWFRFAGAGWAALVEAVALAGIGHSGMARRGYIVGLRLIAA